MDALMCAAHDAAYLEVTARKGKGRRHVLALRGGASDLDGQRALCGARPYGGWSTIVGHSRGCISCAQVLAAEEAAADLRHTRISRILRNEIRAGVLAPGSKFLTQGEVMARFGVGHTTVQNAWAALRREGLIQTRRSGGTYVVEEVPR